MAAAEVDTDVAVALAETSKHIQDQGVVGDDLVQVYQIAVHLHELLAVVGDRKITLSEHAKLGVESPDYFVILQRVLCDDEEGLVTPARLVLREGVKDDRDKVASVLDGDGLSVEVQNSDGHMEENGLGSIQGSVDSLHGGSTVVGGDGGLLLGDCDSREGDTARFDVVGQDLIVGNLGDSRAVLGTRDQKGRLVAHQLTVDLKPDHPSNILSLPKIKLYLYLSVPI
nr:unnamed protein product [Digitaria exilis]